MATTRQDSPAAAPTALENALAQVVRRLRLARWLRLASRGALVSICLSLLCVGLAHWDLLPLWLPLEFTVPILLLLGVGLGTLVAAARPQDAFSAAREVETRLDLKERLSSALEFERAGQTVSDPEAALLMRLQQEDAASHARALRPADAVPLTFPGEAKALVPLVLLLLLALVLPALPLFVPPSVRAERAVVQKSGGDLARTARVVGRRADAQGLPATKSAAQQMQKLGQRMAEGHMDKKQAMVQMAHLSRQMADEQRRLAQAGGSPDQADKSLVQAGRQLTQSLSQPASTGGKASSKSGAASAPHSSSLAGNQTPSGTSSQEMQKAAQALKQNDASALSKQLHALAQRAEAGPGSPTEQQQTSQNLQKLSESLKRTSLSEAQKHVQAAADAMARGDRRRAAAELQHTADAADKQSQRQQDAQGVQDARQALQDSQERMAQTASPFDNGHDSAGHDVAGGKPQTSAPTGQRSQGQGASTGTPQTSGQQAGSGQPIASGRQNGGRQTGTPGRVGGNGRSATPSLSRSSQSSAAVGGSDASARSGALHGAPHPLDAKFNPTQNPKYGKIYLGTGNGKGGGGRTLNAPPGGQSSPQKSTSSVPYYDTLAPARKSAETAMDREDIPPAYRSSVRRYFDALQPPAAKSAK